MLGDWERLMKQVARTSQQVIRVLDEFRGPEPAIRVQDQGRFVRVTITPVPEQKVRRWAVRVQDDRLFIRGHYTTEISVRDELGGFRQERRSDEFVKVVRLPALVETKPTSYRKDGETLTVVFAKRKGFDSSDWLDLRT